MIEPAPQPRLLVTAFEPFGAPGRPRRPSNASEEVVRAFAQRHPDRCAIVVLPVDPRCEVRLARALDGNPSGVVSLGEAGLEGEWDTNVEVRARDLPVEAGRSRPERGGLAADSPLARRIHLLPGMEREDRIGTYWCNRAYFRVLQWCARFDRPGIFLHLRVDGARGRQLRHLEHVVAAMEREAAEVTCLRSASG